MNKNRTLRTVVLSVFSVALTILALVLMTPVASAHTTASGYRIVTATSDIPAVPNVNIIKKNGKSNFSESEVDCLFQSGQPCASITNLTFKDQEIDNLGHTVGTLHPGQTVFLIPSGPGTYPLSLAVNDQAMLNMIAR